MNINWNTIGQKRQKEYLQKQIESGKISHAYLFVGPANLGKIRLAEVFVKSIFCSADQEVNKPCGKCDNCKQIKKGIHPDYYTIDPEKTVKQTDKSKKKKTQTIIIGEIREMIGDLGTSSFGGNWQSVIINKAHNMNVKAANALLKTLEEPGKNRIIILIAESLERMPETVVSRCQVVKFLPIKKDDIIQELLSCSDVKTKQEAEILSSLANGYPEIAIKYLNKPKQLEQYKEEVLWAINFFSKATTAEKIKLLDLKMKRKNENKDIIALMDTWISIWRDVMLSNSDQNYLMVNSFAKEKIEKLAHEWNLQEVKKNIDMFREMRNLSVSMNYKLWLENLIINNF